MTSNIKQISSPTHPISFEFGDTPKAAKVSLANPDVGVPLMQDFTLHIALAEPSKYACVCSVRV